MKKVNVEIDVPDGYEFVRVGRLTGSDTSQGTYIVHFVAEYKPAKKKQIIFTSTGEKRIPRGEWICNDFGTMMRSNGGMNLCEEAEIFTREEKLV